MDGGGTQRDHLQLVRPNDPRLLRPSLSEYEEALLDTFWVLNRDRPYTYGGPLPIKMASFKDYMDLFEDSLTPKEIQVLMVLDTTYLEAKHKMSKGATDGNAT